jgi:hypothetical protein
LTPEQTFCYVVIQRTFWLMMVAILLESLLPIELDGKRL